MITKRYTPPTCTLETIAKQPLWSRFRGESVLEDFQFQLSFDDPRLPKEEYVSVRGDRQQLNALHQAVNHYIQKFLNHSVQPSASFQVSYSPPSSDIYLESDGLLYHDLFLGSLAQTADQSLVHLNVLQLFDLATALQDCLGEIADVPTRKAVPFQILPLVRTALTIVVSIGALTGLIKLINHHQKASSLAITPLPETEPLPPPNLTTPKTLAPWPTPTATPPALETLPVDLPAVTTAPLSVPPPIFPESLNPAPPANFPEVNPNTNQLVIIPAPAPRRSPVAPVTPTPSSNPDLIPTASVSTPVSAPVSAAVAQVPNVIQLPPLQNPESPVVVNVPPPESNLQQDTVVKPEAEESVSDLDQLNKRPQTLAAIRQEETTLFDQTPQVAEVRTYFQDHWYPPKYLKRSLQYNLQLNADGSLQSITPIGQPAVNRLPQIPFPETGESFVSENIQGNPLTVRVILQPNGRVQTFLESN